MTRLQTAQSGFHHLGVCVVEVTALDREGWAIPCSNRWQPGPQPQQTAWCLSPRRQLAPGQPLRARPADSLPGPAVLQVTNHAGKYSLAAVRLAKNSWCHQGLFGVHLFLLADQHDCLVAQTRYSSFLKAAATGMRGSGILSKSR